MKKIKGRKDHTDTEKGKIDHMRTQHALLPFFPSSEGVNKGEENSKEMDESSERRSGGEDTNASNNADR
jgi:hypothetical protein